MLIETVCKTEAEPVEAHVVAMQIDSPATAAGVVAAAGVAAAAGAGAATPGLLGNMVWSHEQARWLPDPSAHPPPSQHHHHQQQQQQPTPTPTPTEREKRATLVWAPTPAGAAAHRSALPLRHAVALHGELQLCVGQGLRLISASGKSFGRLHLLFLCVTPGPGAGAVGGRD